MVPDAKGQEQKQQKDPRARQAAISVHLQTSHRPPPPRASPHIGDTTPQEQGIWPFPACRGQAPQRLREGTGGPYILMSIP